MSMERRRVPRAVSIAAWLAALLPGTAACNRQPSGGPTAAPTAAPVSAARPHVILVSLCSVRADHLGCYGYPRDTSPAIDGLARDGVRFEQAVTPWPKTAPSFCSVMTGLWPHQTNVLRTTPNQRLADDVLTLAERLVVVGYRTAAFVTTQALSRKLNLDQGFSVYQATWYKSAAEGRAGKRLPTVDYAREWLKRRNGQASLLWVHFNDAHYPYHGRPDLRGRYVDDAHYDSARAVRVHEKPVLPIALPSNHPAADSVARADLGGVHPGTAIMQERPTQLDYYVARYDAAIRTADDEVGRLVAAVRDVLGDEPYLLLLWSDHGESLGEHNYYFEHGRFAYETCLRVPLILYESGRPGGTRVAEPVSLVDIAATIAARVGAATEGLAGVSLLNVAGGLRPRGDVFFCAGYHADFITGVRRGPLKYVRVPNALDQQFMKCKPAQLHDLSADPGEVQGLDAAADSRAAALSAALEQWIRPWWDRVVRSAAPLKPIAYSPDEREGLIDMGYLSPTDATGDGAGGGIPATRPDGL